MKELDQIDRIIKKYEEYAGFCGPVPVSRIREEEALLGLKFPMDYRYFLRQYGAGTFEACEIYGIVPEKDTACIPNGMWATACLREKVQLPQAYIAVGFDGFGGYYCIDTSNPGKDGLCPVVLFAGSPEDEISDGAEGSDDAGSGKADIPNQSVVLAENFAFFLLAQLKEEIDRMI